MTIKPYSIGSSEWNGLSKVIEELGELQQVCGKTIGSGGDQNHWSGNLVEKFIEEIGDSYAALDFFVDQNFSREDQARIYKQAHMKYERFRQWDKETKQND